MLWLCEYYKMAELETVSDISGVYLILHNFGVHVRDEADGELADDLAGDDSLGPYF